MLPRLSCTGCINKSLQYSCRKTKRQNQGRDRMQLLSLESRPTSTNLSCCSSMPLLNDLFLQRAGSIRHMTSWCYRQAMPKLKYDFRQQLFYMHILSNCRVPALRILLHEHIATCDIAGMCMLHKHRSSACLEKTQQVNRWQQTCQHGQLSSCKQWLICLCQT